MNFSNQLSVLLISNRLSADERLIAEHLQHTPDLTSFFSKLDLAEIVVVPTVGLPPALGDELKKMETQWSVIFPIIPLGIMSVSPSLSAKSNSQSVCSLLKKLCPDKPMPLKGVLSLSTGISVNHLQMPGSLVWKLQYCSCLSFATESVSFHVAAAFIDAYTMSVSVATKVFSNTFPTKALTTECLIKEAHDALTNAEEFKNSQWALKCMAKTVMPAPYQSAIWG